MVGGSRMRTLWLAAVLLLALPLLLLVATAYSETGAYPIDAAMRTVLAELGIVERAADHTILKLRLMRALCAIGVGGSLALAGAMTQGLFRNPLAEPGLLGVSTGASLGAVIAIAIIGGYGPNWKAWSGGASDAGESFVSLGIVPVIAMAGALATAVSIYRIATRDGRISIPALLLTGLAINSMLGALIAALQVLLVQDWQVARAILSWGFGTLDDRTPFHLVVVWSGALLALASIPFVGLELDLMAGGEDDAAALGANPARVKTLVLLCVALATAAAVSVSGVIGFVGLLVPHLVRMAIGPHHRALLPVSFLAGGVLLLGVVVLQHAAAPALGDVFAKSGHTQLEVIFKRLAVLQPGVVTSLMGAPFFLYLLLRQKSMASL